MRAWLWALLAVMALLAASGCSERERVFPSVESGKRLEIARARRQLRGYEAELRRAIDLQSAAPFTRAMGPDPYRLCRVGSVTVGLLRGSSELVLLDAELDERARGAAPDTPVDCAVTPRGEVIVIGELAREIATYRLVGDGLQRVASLPLPDAVRPRALAVYARRLWLADEGSGRVSSFEFGEDGALRAGTSAPLCRGPIALAVEGRNLLANCLLDHALVVRELTANGELGKELARITHSGPFWGFSARERGGALFIAASGVEDHPLERFGGAFGYVDSFLYLYRVKLGAVQRLQAINASELSLLVPKALLLEEQGAELALSVSSYGSDGLAEFRFEHAGPERAPRVTRRAFVPGVSALERVGSGLVAASPLLDSWARLESNGAVAVRASRARAPLPPPSVRLGEALVFTELIAPFATSEGKKSRFTCETCHFEGGVDGRIHHTGRGEVRVSTRPLFGLLQNAPHFSRALDPDLASVSHNEFRVAALGNDYDPWFTLPARRFPWLQGLGVEGELGPEPLRRALIDFLARFEPEQNPKAFAQRAFSPLERKGAEHFKARCASCHAARLASDDAHSELPFERWEASIFSAAGPIVWARGDYEKTGVQPYVHAKGTRIPSLRRVGRKYPYFTDGSARSLADVLAGARVDEQRFFHARAPAAARPLTPDEQRGIASFLELL
jgi:hypothetical protein